MAPSWHIHNPICAIHKHVCEAVHGTLTRETNSHRCTQENNTRTKSSKAEVCLHTQRRLPIAHAFVQGKMCLAGKELFSVNSYKSSSQTWVLGWAATIPPWAANYWERTYESSCFILCWYRGANCWPSCLITACSVMLPSTIFAAERDSS